MMDKINPDNKLVTLEWALRNGVSFARIKDSVSSGELIKIDRGLYAVPGTHIDDLFIIQHRYSKGIYSGLTALSLNGLTEHESMRIFMTFPKGYNPSSLKDDTWHIDVTRVIPELYGIGVRECRTENGTVIRTYGPERTLCDCLRGKGISRYILNDAMRRYFSSDYADIDLLREYSVKLHVAQKIESYIQMST